MLTVHAEDAAFLWLTRDNAVRAPHYALKDLAKLDDRVEAHIDGLRVAGDDGWALALEQLKHPEGGEYFAAMVLALESGRKEKIAAVVERAQEAGALRGVVSALGWVDWEVAKPAVGGLIASTEPRLRRIAIAACAITRNNPGIHLANALAHADPALRARACRAVGELARKDLLGEMAPQLAGEDETCRFWAAWSATLLGDPRGFAPLWKFISGTASRRTARALAVLLRALPPAQAQDWLKMLGRDPERRRAAITGVGVYGDPTYASWLIQQMADEKFTRLAGEAFAMMTGVDLAYIDLDRRPPEGVETGPNDDPADPDVELDPDNWLPWPDPERVARWWGAQRNGYAPGTRYLLGKPITPESLTDILRTGRQRQRAAAALELTLRTGAMLFETRARGQWQQQRLKPQ
ncbi:MAG TPA: TIGR02270 family protein [Stellaceae bacterium]|nr:TIGR02270 family protein [Stellaceae bacterium]